MPQVVAIKFYEEMMPRRYHTGEVKDLKLQDFVVAYRDGGEDVGFVAAVEWVSSEQLRLRKDMLGDIARRATETEKEAYFVRKSQERKALTLCKTKAEAQKLPMKVSMVRIDPRTGKYIFHFTSEQRVDFRNLVKELSEELHGRIELWQIGVRDEAKAIDGFGVCGQQTCCSSWLPDFRPINIRMAKTQDINLPPAKLSGQCGRLLCCLSYEVDQYKEMSKGLLPKGATIKVEGRDGVIYDRNILRQTYEVHFQDGGNASVTAGDLTEVRVPEQMKRMAEVFDRTRKPEKEEAGLEETALDDPKGDSSSEDSEPVQRPGKKQNVWNNSASDAPEAELPKPERKKQEPRRREDHRAAAPQKPRPPKVEVSRNDEADEDSEDVAAGGEEGQTEEGQAGERTGRKRTRTRSRRRGRNRTGEPVAGAEASGEASGESAEPAQPRERREARVRPPKPPRAPKPETAGNTGESAEAAGAEGGEGEEKKVGRNRGRRRGGRRRGGKGTPAAEGQGGSQPPTE